MSSAKAGASLTLKFGSGPTTVPEVTNFSWGGRNVGFDDVTHFNSPNFYSEYIATFKEPGEITFTTNYLPDDAAYAALDALYEARTTETWTLTHDNWAGTWTFSAFVEELSPLESAEPKKAMKSSVKLKLSGQPVYA